MKSGAKTYPKAVDTLYGFLRRIFRPACRSSVLSRILWFVAQWHQALQFLGHLKQRMGHKSSLSLNFPAEICVMLEALE